MEFDTYVDKLVNSHKDEDNFIIATKIARAAENNIKEIANNLYSGDVTKNCYAYKHRLKNEDSLLEKLNRKTQKDSPYSLFNITDVVGFRFVTLFTNDMKTTYREILSKISSDKLFYTPKEIIVYIGNRIDSSFVSAIKNITKEILKIEADVKPDENGYSSIHIVCACTNKINTIEGYFVPVEIQIRTVFEDAWGEIDHKYKYKQKTGKDNEDHIKTLKTFTDGCMAYAEKIRELAEREIYTRDIAAETSYFDFEKSLFSKIENLDLDSNFIEKFKSLIILGQEIHKKYESDNKNDDVKNEFIEISDRFLAEAKEVYDPSSSTITEIENYLPYYYYTFYGLYYKMSLNTATDDSFALNIFCEIEKLFPNSIPIKIRVAQILGREKKVDEAILKFEESKKMLEDYKNIASNKNMYSDYIFQAEEEFCSHLAPKMIGYLLWEKTQTNDKILYDEKMKLLYEAHEQSLESLKYAIKDEQKVKILNNLLYYSTQYIFESKEENNTSNCLKSNIKRYLNELIKVSNLKASQIDTIYKAYYVLHDMAAAREYAHRLEQCIFSGSIEHKNPSTVLEMLLVAKKFLREGIIVKF